MASENKQEHKPQCARPAGSDNVREASGQQYKQTTKQQPTHTQPMELCGVGTAIGGFQDCTQSHGVKRYQCQGIPHSVGGRQRSTISWTEAKLRWFMYKCHYELVTDSQTHFVVYGSV